MNSFTVSIVMSLPRYTEWQYITVLGCPHSHMHFLVKLSSVYMMPCPVWKWASVRKQRNSESILLVFLLVLYSVFYLQVSVFFSPSVLILFLCNYLCLQIDFPSYTFFILSHKIYNLPTMSHSFVWIAITHLPLSLCTFYYLL